MNDPNALMFFDEIKLETEEKNEKFVLDTEKKGIEIKMAVVNRIHNSIRYFCGEIQKDLYIIEDSTCLYHLTKFLINK